MPRFQRPMVPSVRALVRLVSPGKRGRLTGKAGGPDPSSVDPPCLFPTAKQVVPAVIDADGRPSLPPPCGCGGARALVVEDVASLDAESRTGMSAQRSCMFASSFGLNKFLTRRPGIFSDDEYKSQPTGAARCACSLFGS